MAAAKAGHPVLFFSLEMKGDSIVKRILSAQTGSPYSALVEGPDIPAQNRKMGEAISTLCNLPIQVMDPERMDLFRLRAITRRFRAKNENMMPLIVIDYLQLCVRGGGSDKRRNEAIGDFTRECKALARELRCPFLLLSQISRDAKEVDNPFKAKDSLKDSGNIEEDADTIMLAVAELSKNLKDTAKENGLVDTDILNFGVVKNREESVGLCPLFFNKRTQRVVGLRDYINSDYGAENNYPEQENLI